MSKDKQFKLPNRNSWVRAKLRKASLQWPAREYAIELSKSDKAINEQTGRYNQTYKCNICKTNFFRNEIEVDHINPIRPIESKKINWHEFIENLLCNVEDLQVLCSSCHEQKTALEQEARYNKGKKKK